MNFRLGVISQDLGAISSESNIEKTESTTENDAQPFVHTHIRYTSLPVTMPVLLSDSLPQENSISSSQKSLNRAMANSYQFKDRERLCDILNDISVEDNSTMTQSFTKGSSADHLSNNERLNLRSQVRIGEETLPVEVGREVRYVRYTVNNDRYERLHNYHEIDARKIDYKYSMREQEESLFSQVTNPLRYPVELHGKSMYYHGNCANDVKDPLNLSSKVFVNEFGGDLEAYTRDDFLHVLKLVKSTNPAVASNALAYLQHLVYCNPHAKETFRKTGGLACLVGLLYSNSTEVSGKATAVLRNLTWGDNLAVKEQLKQVGGLRALTWLTHDKYIRYKERFWSMLSKNIHEGKNQPFHCEQIHEIIQIREALEDATFILTNISSVAHLKPAIFRESLQQGLIDIVLLQGRHPAIREALQTNVFVNILNTIRNVSSSQENHVRDYLRQYPNLLRSLLAVIQSSVIYGSTDSNAIEHCVSCLRNLCYRLHHIEIANTASDIKTNCEGQAIRNGKNAMRLGLRSSFGRWRSSNRSKDEPTPAPRDDGATSVLWIPGTTRILMNLLCSTTNSHTLEAAVGTIQNLTSGDWLSSTKTRFLVRTQHGLPVLIKLLTVSAPSVLKTTCGALKNLSVDTESCRLLGRHGLPSVVACMDQWSSALDDQEELDGPAEVVMREGQKQRRSSSTSLSWPETRLACLDRIPSCRSYRWTSDALSTGLSRDNLLAVMVSILDLCLVLVRDCHENARRFLTCGGIERCQELLAKHRVVKNQRCLTGCYVAYSEEHVELLVKAVLSNLWKFTELRPIYKLAGWTDADFCAEKRKSNRISSLIRRRSETDRQRKLSVPDQLPTELTSDSLLYESAEKRKPTRNRQNQKESQLFEKIVNARNSYNLGQSFSPPSHGICKLDLPTEVVNTRQQTTPEISEYVQVNIGDNASICTRSHHVEIGSVFTNINSAEKKEVGHPSIEGKHVGRSSENSSYLSSYPDSWV